jgi:hypothetical protein
VIWRCQRAAKRPSSPNNCTAIKEQDYRDVTNNYIGFYLNKQTIGTTLGGDPRRDAGESVKRCQANGIPSARCNEITKY